MGAAAAARGQGEGLETVGTEGRSRWGLAACVSGAGRCVPICTTCRSRQQSSGREVVKQLQQVYAMQQLENMLGVAEQCFAV